MFAEACNLRWVQSIGSGIDGVLFDDFVESDIILTSAKGTVGTHLADHAWALILALTRGIHTALREKTWQCPNANPSPVMGTGGYDSWVYLGLEARVSRWRVGPRGSECVP